MSSLMLRRVQRLGLAKSCHAISTPVRGRVWYENLPRHANFATKRERRITRREQIAGIRSIQVGDLDRFRRSSSEEHDTPASRLESVAPYLMQHNQAWLRDACRCPRCIDQSTSQRLFQASDIPLNIKGEILKESKSDFQVKWQNDIPGFEDHVSCYNKRNLLHHFHGQFMHSIAPVGFAEPEKVHWDAATMTQKIQFVEYEDYMNSDSAFFKVLEQLHMYGLVFIKNAPTQEVTVEKLVERIGHLRETFYGRTWNVKSVPQAKNVAYTSQFLGFHMDLLYMADPPGFQFLHSLKSSCAGGESMFMDSFLAAEQLLAQESTPETPFKADLPLLRGWQTFHYDNDGKHYEYKRPVIELDVPCGIKCVNWSPPFQGLTKPWVEFKKVPRMPPVPFEDYVRAAKEFSSIVEDPKNIYEYRMEEGDCVIFNNRRVLHARREFDTTSGERWLKGAYLSTDEFNSRYRTLAKTMRKEEFAARRKKEPRQDVPEDNLEIADNWLDHELQSKGDKKVLIRRVKTSS